LVNTEALRKKIADRGIKYKNIAAMLGISPYTLQLKVDGKNEFVTSEVSGLCDILEITDLAEKEEIFFAKKVD
jgi:DNA-binding Xre family transcriptional regulator